MNFIRIGGLLAGIAVALGAFGAHALKNRTDEAGLKTWETAVRYHIYHALGLIAIGLLQLVPVEAETGWPELSGLFCYEACRAIFSLTS